MASDQLNPSTWFSDESSLITALRQSRQLRGTPPMIDGYDDLVELARGGQGIVYMATQRSTRRRVAIKVLRDRLDGNDEAQRRFEREIDLIASLRHANIVRVFDSGRARPPHACAYLIMEYIPGLPLDEFVRERSLGLRPLVTLFATICDAITFAHRNGIIHRDLKPSNIRIDPEGVPHVLDFGLAKLGVRAGEPSLAASITSEQSGAFMGSLPWASPEQAEGRVDQVDLRSDIYALGAILYQLTTGRTVTDLTGGLRRVLERIASTPPVSPRTLNRAVDQDLETIVLQCLEKEPDRRYQSVGALSEDLRRWLAGDPIEARRESAWSAMRRRVQRNQRMSATLLVGTLLMTGALGIAIWQAMRAHAQQQIAERRFNDVRTLAQTFLFDFHDAIATLPGSHTAREMVAATALRYLDELAVETTPERSLQLERIHGYRRVGDIQGDPYSANLGDLNGAMKSYETAHAIASALVAADNGDDDAREAMAEIDLSIGDLLLSMGDRDGSLERFAMARSQAEDLLARNSERPSLRRVIASSFVKRGDTLADQGLREEAEKEFRAALAMFEALCESITPPAEVDRINSAVCHGKIGFIQQITGKPEQALASFEQALAISSALSAEKPLDGVRMRSVAILHNQVGEALVALDRFEQSLQQHQAALAISERLAAADPRNALAQADLSYTLNRIGEVHMRRNQPEQALPLYEQAMVIRQAMSQSAPENAALRRDLCVSLWKVADLNSTLGGSADQDRLERAESLLSLCIDHLDAMRTNGTLNEVDAKWPEMARDARNEIAKRRAAAAVR